MIVTLCMMTAYFLCLLLSFLAIVVYSFASFMQPSHHSFFYLPFNLIPVFLSFISSYSPFSYPDTTWCLQYFPSPAHLPKSNNFYSPPPPRIIHSLNIIRSYSTIASSKHIYFIIFTSSIVK